MVSNLQIELSALIVFVVTIIFFAGGFFSIVSFRLKQINQLKEEVSEIRKEILLISQRLAKIEGLISGVGNERLED